MGLNDIIPHQTRWLIAARAHHTATDNGWNNYNISPNRRGRSNTSSSYGKAPKISLLDLTNGTVARV
jgi:hypothetical protein